MQIYAFNLNDFELPAPNIRFIVQTSHFQPTNLPQVGLVAGSLGLTLGYGLGWLIPFPFSIHAFDTSAMQFGIFDGHKLYAIVQGWAL